MDLFIIRHGQSANNALPNIRDREVDPTLTDLGKRQAAILAEHLAVGETHDLSASATTGIAKVQLLRGFGITRLFTSPMYRSLQTVRPIGQSLDLAPQVWIDIHEEGGMYLDQGGDEGLVGYPGRTRSEILEEFPDYQLPPGISETGWWNKGHEDPSALATRAIRVSDHLHEMATREQRVALITHGLFMDVLQKALFGQLPGENIYYRNHNTAISRISINAGERVEVRYLNRIEHLDSELVS